MSKRRLSGFLILALGFGCASLATTATAQEPFSEEGELAEGLSYVNTENEVELVNTGEGVYVVMVTRSPGTLPTGPAVLYRAGTTTVSRFGLVSLKVYQLMPIAELEADFWRPCIGADCSWQGPLPPPPPPIAPPDLSALFLSPQ